MFMIIMGHESRKLIWHLKFFTEFYVTEIVNVRYDVLIVKTPFYHQNQLEYFFYLLKKKLRKFDWKSRTVFQCSGLAEKTKAFGICLKKPFECQKPFSLSSKKTMCTVTYIPIQKDHFILTSNRDEAPARAARLISEKTLEPADLLIFPQDSKAGGTWIAGASNNRVVCLLNGAFVKHSHSPPYKMSRGQMVLQFFDFPHAGDFAQNFDFEGIEPFTMVIVDQGDLLECRWDEKQIHLKNLPSNDPRIWSSSTLYPPDYQQKREGVFENWLKSKPGFSKETILHLHRSGVVGDPEYDFIMNRQNRVRTVSITCIEKTGKDLSMDFFDLLAEPAAQVISKKIPLNAGIQLAP